MRRVCRARPWKPTASAGLAFALATTFATAPGGAQAPVWGGAFVARVDSMAASILLDGRISGFSVAVRKGDDLLLARGYGFADLELGVPAQAQSIYGIGSVTKQFTAAAIMRLVEEGRMALDDPITRFLPDYETHGHTVTIRHLLTHTSGIPSYTGLEAWEPLQPLDLTDEELRALFEDLPFDFLPGESFRYNNSGYLLLGMIVEAVTGEPYADYVRDHLAHPLGLEHTSYCDTRRITPGRASGYWVEDGELVNADFLSMTHPGAAGALCSSVLDLLSWSRALRDGRVVSPASYAQMVTPMVLNDGTDVPYGFGLRPMERLAGHPAIWHGGGVNGYTTTLDYYPEADLELAVISNTNGFHVRRIADTMARWALGIRVPAVDDRVRSQEELAAFEGTYGVSDSEWVVDRQGAWLYVTLPGSPPSRLRAQEGPVFVPEYSDFARITFQMDDGRATGFSIYECVPTDPERCRTREGARIH